MHPQTISYISRMNIIEENGEELIAILMRVFKVDEANARIIPRSKLDVVYSSYINWEREKLLLHNNEKEKGTWKKLNVFEYLWVKIVSVLRQYGFSHDEIKDYRDDFLHTYKAQDFASSLDDTIEIVSGVNKEFGQMLLDNKEYLNSKLKHVNATFIECLFYLEVIGKPTEILFYKDYGGVFCIKNSTFELVAEHMGFRNNVLESYNHPHLSVSIRHLLKGLETIDLEDVSEHHSMITEQEEALLKQIRKKDKNLRSISIRYKDGEPFLLEIKQGTKAIDVESRLMDHIQRGEYSTIEIGTQNGKISSFENTKRIKL